MKARYFILFAVVMIPLFLLRDFTPDNELRYLSIADEALRHGTFFTFYNHGLAYADKPPLYLWIVMSGKLLFGSHCMLFLGLFSLIPALVILYVMDRWTEGVLAPNNRKLALLMLMSSAYFIGSAAVLRMDMLMCMFIVLALHTFYKMYCGERSWRNRILFPLFVFLALFSKGPVGILVPLLSVIVFLALRKELNTLGRYWGWLTWVVLIVLCGGWFMAVYAEGGMPYLHNLLFNQTVNRAVDAFHHKRPFYYYFLSVWYVVAPWSLLIAGVWFTAIKARLLKTDLEQLFLTVVVVTMVMLSLISSKVDIYLLPLVPFMIYLTLLLLQKLPQTGVWLKVLVAIPVAVITLAIPVGVLLLRKEVSDLSPMIYVAGLFMLVAGGVTLWLLIKSNTINKAIVLFAGSMLVFLLLVSPVIPQINSRIGYREICQSGMQMAERSGLSEFYIYNVRRGENMDVYLHQDVGDLTETSPDQWNNLRGILFCREKDITKNKSLQHVVAGKLHIAKGEYVAVALQ